MIVLGRNKQVDIIGILVYHIIYNDDILMWTQWGGGGESARTDDTLGLIHSCTHLSELYSNT